MDSGQYAEATAASVKLFGHPADVCMLLAIYLILTSDFYKIKAL